MPSAKSANAASQKTGERRQSVNDPITPFAGDPVGVIPAESELVMDDLEVPAEDLHRILTIDTDRWRQEMGFREEHLAQFERLPEEIWAAHRRVAGELG